MFDPGYKPQLISRIEQPERRMFGWQLKLRRKGAGDDTYYSDHDYDDNPMQSLKALEGYRDSVIHKFPLMKRWEVASIIRSHNTSGVPGVTCKPTKVHKPNGKTYHYFRCQVSLRSDVLPRAKHKSFYAPLEDEDAHEDIKTLAIAQRLEWEDELQRIEHANERNRKPKA